MTAVDPIYYTESFMSDLLKQFFNRYKKNNSYKYVDMIDSNIMSSQVIEIDYRDFTYDIKNMLKNQTEERIHTAMYRALGEVFQVRYGSDRLDNVKHEDILKFRVSNSDVITAKVYSNPDLSYYEHYTKEMFEGADKIDNVAAELQKKYKFVTLRKTEEILLYDGKIYDNSKAETIIKEETEKLIPNCTTNNRKEVINKIKAQSYTDLEKFDADPNLITVENGILNLETLELKPHTPKHLSRVLLPVKYHKPKHEIKEETIFTDIEENLKGTLFWKSLKSSFTVDGKFRRKDFETVLEMTACGIIKRHIDEKAFMNLGQGENGKSIFLQYIESLLGAKNISRVPLQDISEDKFLVASLDGMSANIFTDLGKNELRHTGKIKAITSNEGVAAQKKYGQPFTLYPFCKLIFSCNRFPKVYDQSQGFFRRWIIIEWKRNFENDPERDEHLLAKLTSNQDEKNRVFSCLVGIANKLNKVGKFTHSKDWKTIQREWNANADPIDDFVTNYIKDSENNKSKRETYQFYKEITLSKGETPLGMGQFSKAFAEYYDEDRTNRVRVWLNIDFKRPIQTTLNEVNTQ